MADSLESLNRTVGHLCQRRRGFALIVTVSMLILLSLIAIGLLTLSTITVRTSRAGADQAEARANARMAALLALGELQKLAGPDTRITAPETIYGEEEATEEASSPVTGVWRSWEGLDRDEKLMGRPKAPDYELKKTRGSTSDDDAEGRFLGYLVSRNGEDEWDPASPPDLRRGAVTLVGDHSVGDDDEARQVRLDPVKVNGQRGSYAWWVSGENQKARLGNLDEPDQPAEWAELHASGDYADATVFHFKDLEDLPKAISLPTLDLLPSDPPGGNAEPVSRRSFHDLTGWSRGLLTNAAAGGFKRDLSLLTERWDDLPRGKLPFYTVRPGEETEASLDAGGAQRFLYPWALTANASNYGSNFGPVVPWEAVKDFCLQYRQIAGSTPKGNVAIPQFATAKPAVSVTRVRRYPQVARMHFVYAYSAIPDHRNPGQLIACMVVNPVVTMWNPYNVELTVDRMYLQTFEATPIRLKITVGSQTFNPIPLSYLMFAHQDVNKRIKQRYNLDGGPFMLKPGETLVFSHKGDRPVNKTRSGAVSLEPGYRTHGGMRFTRIGAVPSTNAKKPWMMTEVTGGPGTVFRAEIDLDAGTNHAKTSNVRGYYWNLFGDGQGKIGYHRLEIDESTVNQEKFWEELRNIRTTTLGEASAESKVFVSSQFGYRMATDPITKRGFIVSGVDSSAGLHRCTMVELPLRPLRSLPELQHLDLRNENRRRLMPGTSSATAAPRRWWRRMTA